MPPVSSSSRLKEYFNYSTLSKTDSAKGKESSLGTTLPVERGTLLGGGSAGWAPFGKESNWLLFAKQKERAQLHKPAEGTARSSARLPETPGAC